MKPPSDSAPLPRYIRVHGNDNVAIVVNDGGLPAGTQFPGGLTLQTRVPQGHKVSLVPIAVGAPVIRYNVTIGIAARLDERDWAMPDKNRHGREGGRLRQKTNGSQSKTWMAAAAAMTRRDSTDVAHMKEKPRQTAPHARRSSENSFSTITGTRADDQDAHRDRHLWPD